MTPAATGQRRAEGGDEEAREDREGRGLGRDRHERRYRRRRALVDVGVHWWNGAIETLKASPTATKAIPIKTSGSSARSVPITCAIAVKSVAPPGAAVDEREAVELTSPGV